MKLSRQKMLEWVQRGVTNRERGRRFLLHTLANEGRLSLLRTVVGMMGNEGINALDDAGTSPLYHACSQGRFATARFLLENGADPNGGQSPLWAAVGVWDVNPGLLVALWRAGADAHTPNENGDLPLHRLCQCQTKWETLKPVLPFVPDEQWWHRNAAGRRPVDEAAWQIRENAHAITVEAHARLLNVERKSLQSAEATPGERKEPQRAVRKRL